jgi:GNAT superfamily N-acetyltransferase
MQTKIFIAQSDTEIQDCFSLFKVLRPHLNEEEFLPQVRRQQIQGYQILALEHEDMIKSAAGFRIVEFLAWGKILYIDDLVTLPDQKKRGYGGTLLDWLITHAQNKKCAEIHLDTGYARHDAHKLYLGKWFHLSAHHMSKQLLELDDEQ